MNSNELLLERNGSRADITFNRPEVRNALTLAMWRRLAELIWELDEDNDVRVIVLQGAGKSAFAAGADIKEFAQVRGNRKQAEEYTEAVEGALSALLNFGKPVVAQLRGACVGGGLEVAASCDLRIASEQSRFGIPTAKIGVLAGWGELKRCVELMGPGVTADLLFTARLYSAKEAYEKGLLTHVAPDNVLEAYVDSTCRRIASGSPLTHRIHKRMLQIVARVPALQNLTEAERQLAWASFDSRDYREGVAAFIEKREPDFRGD